MLIETGAEVNATVAVTLREEHGGLAIGKISFTYYGNGPLREKWKIEFLDYFWSEQEVRTPFFRFSIKFYMAFRLLSHSKKMIFMMKKRKNNK